MKDFLSKHKKMLVFGTVALVVLLAGGVAYMFASDGSTSADTGVKEVTVVPGSIESTVTGKGNVEAGKEINITAPLGVMVEEVYVKSGDSVEVGQALADVQSSSVAGKLADMISQEEAVQDQLDTLDLSYLERDALEGQRENLRDTISQLRSLYDYPVITAPQNGIVDSVYLSNGEPVTKHSVSPGSGDSQDAASAAASLFSTAPRAVRASTLKTTTPVGVSTGDGNREPVALSLQSGTLPAGTTAAGLPVTEKIIDFSSLKLETPVAGVSPQRELTQSPYYTAALSWDCAGGLFKPDTTYTANISLRSNPGYTFSMDYLPDLPGCVDSYELVGADGAPGNGLNVTARFAATRKTAEEPLVQSQDATPGEMLVGDASDGSGDIYIPDEGPTQDSSAPEYYPGGGYGEYPDDGFLAEYGSGNSYPSQPESASETEGESPAAEYTQNQIAAESSANPGTASPAQTGTQSLAAETSPSLDFSTYDAVAFTMSSMDEVIVKIDVDERDILKLTQGQQAEVKLDAIPDETFTGTISRISGSATPTDGSTKYAVDVSLNPDVRLKGGMSANVTVKTGNNQNVLVIPIEALQERDGAKFVYTTKDDDGNLGGEVNVQTGLSNANYVEITEGLKQGMVVYYKEPDLTDAADDSGGDEEDSSADGQTESDGGEA